MTEINRDRLTGETKMTSSSGDLLAPYTGKLQVVKNDSDVDSNLNDKVVYIAKLSHNDSGFAKNILEDKLQSRKKAA